MKRLSLFYILAACFSGATVLSSPSAWALCPASEAIVSGIYKLDVASCKLRKEARGRLEKPGVESSREVCVLEMNCEATAPLNKSIRCPTYRKAYCWADRNNKCPAAATCAQSQDFKQADVKYVKTLNTVAKKRLAPGKSGVR